jgi:hypothetical protein
MALASALLQHSALPVGQADLCPAMHGNSASASKTSGLVVSVCCLQPAAAAYAFCHTQLAGCASLRDTGFDAGTWRLRWFCPLYVKSTKRLLHCNTSA